MMQLQGHTWMIITKSSDTDRQTDRYIYMEILSGCRQVVHVAPAQANAHLMIEYLST